MTQYNAPDDTFSNIIKVKTDNTDHLYHPAQKPLKLIECLISLVTLEEQIVLDPFMGSGTTCVAARNLNRHYIGIDINPANIETAHERLNASFQREIDLYGFVPATALKI